MHITTEIIQSTATYKGIKDSTKKSLIVNKENRDKIKDGIAICKASGFENWERIYQPSPIILGIVRELLNG